MSVPYCYQDADYRLQHASKILTQYWRIHHRLGARCDFDGIAELLPDYTYGSDPSDTLYGSRFVPGTMGSGIMGGTGALPRLSLRALRARLPAPGVALLAVGLTVAVVAAAAAAAPRPRLALSLSRVWRSRWALRDERALREPLAYDARGAGLEAPAE